jgi:hypothetical protein
MPPMAAVTNNFFMKGYASSIQRQIVLFAVVDSAVLSGRGIVHSDHSTTKKGRTRFMPWPGRSESQAPAPHLVSFVLEFG